MLERMRSDQVTGASVHARVGLGMAVCRLITSSRKQQLGRSLTRM